MNQQAILQSNLLDIIFENRNKDYGAYTLRKSYQRRLSVAVLSTAGLSLILSLFLLSNNSSIVFKPGHTGVPAPGKNISNFHPAVQPANKKIVKPRAVIKSKPVAERPPLIVASDNINSLPATLPEIESSFTGINVPGMNPVLNAGETGEGGMEGKDPAIKAGLPGPDKSIPVEVAEIMPQYPGGVQALLSFLKKNIHSPGNVEEGEDVTVKIEFVVNYNGNLENFIVIKSGGAIFDNEVLRVLKKMPLWIPGKSKGKNVSVYYTVPVKFTSEF